MTFDEQIHLIRKSGCFDSDWYLAEYPDVAQIGIDPIAHYVKYGAALGRDPSGHFHTRRYVLENARIIGKGNPLVHFLLAQEQKNGHSRTDCGDNESVVSVEEKPKYSARIERIDVTGISGWFVPPQHSQLSSWSIIVEIDGVFETSTAIDRDRPDVTRAHGRLGAGFLLPIPGIFLDGNEHTAIISAVKSNQRSVIARREFSLKSQWRTISDMYCATDGPPIVLFCSHNFKIQGAQTSLYELVVGLYSKSVVRPVVYSPSDGPMRNKYERVGIPTIIQPGPGITDSESTWESDMANHVSCVKALGPRAVVANTLQSYISAIAAFRLDIPCLLIPRESEPPESYFDYLPPFLRKLADQIVSKSELVVFVAKATKDLWESQNTRGHFRVIHNGLRLEPLEIVLAGRTREEARYELGLAPSEIVILCVGTVAERKGQLDLIDTLPRLSAQVKRPFRIVLVGMNQSDYANALALRVSGLPKSLRDRVTLLPETESSDSPLVAQLYCAADIFVLCSRHESYPRVILEALYFGLPLVTTPCFGVKEQVEHQVSALYYDPEKLESLSDSLASLVNDDDLRNEFSLAARKRFQELTSYEQMLDEYAQSIRSILSSKV